MNFKWFYCSCTVFINWAGPVNHTFGFLLRGKGSIKNTKRYGFIVTCASAKERITMAAQLNLPFGESSFNLVFC